MSLDAAAAGRQLALKVAHVVDGDRDIDVDNRLEQGRLGLLHGDLERLAGRDLEGDVLAVDRVGLAVDELSLDVDDRTAGQDPLVHLGLDALVDRGSKLGLNVSAVNEVLEFVSFAGVGFDADDHAGELTRPPGLLLVRIFDFLRLAQDRFAIGNSRQARVHFELEVTLHPGQDRSQVQVADASDDQLVGRGVAFGREAGVFLVESSHGPGHLVGVGATLGRDGQGEHWLGHGRHGNGARRARVQDVADVQVDFGQGDDVPRDAGVHLRVFGPLKLEGLPRSQASAIVAGEQMGVTGQTAGVNADGQVFDVALGIVGNLEHLRDERAIGVRLDRLFDLVDDELPPESVDRRRGHRDDGIEQLGYADLVAGVGEQDRHEPARSHGARGGAGQFRVVQLAGEVLLHQSVVHADDALDDGGVGIGDAAEVALSVFGGEAVDDPFAAAGRERKGLAFLPEGFLNLLDQLGEVDVFGIDLVDDDHPAKPVLLGFFHHPPAVQLDAGRGRDDAHHRLTRRQGRDGRSGKVRGAGRVDDVDLFALV